jgi:hypothetical protein
MFLESGARSTHYCSAPHNRESGSSSNELKDCVEIGFLTNVEIDGNGWENSRGPAGEVTEHGWTRYSFLFLGWTSVLMILFTEV